MEGGYKRKRASKRRSKKKVVRRVESYGECLLRDMDSQVGGGKETSKTRWGEW